VRLRARGPPRGARRRRGGKERQLQQVKEKEQEDDIVLLSADGHTVSDLAQKLGKSAAGIITYFFAQKGMPLTLNDVLDKDLISDFAESSEIEVLFDDEEQESVASQRGFLAETHADAQPRPPVVTVMGHVDHGKTTLLDTIRQRSVAATEAGGITQRIGAYTVEVGESKEKATFIDTPGHEAFTAMRARGAQVTDIAILVVAASDGVMPQTREAIAHAKAAEVPIIVAINKIDLPNADTDQTRQSLSEEGLICEEWGGEIPMVECSARKNINIDGLLEIVTLTAQVGELKAPYDVPAAGVVLESTFESSRGSLATLLVQRGTLRIGNIAVAGTKICRVRSMQNEAGQALPEVTPATAVQVLGFDKPPEAGEQFEVFPTIQAAREVANRRGKKSQKPGVVGFTGLTAPSEGDQVVRLAVILKTDAQGSIAAVKHMFGSVKDSKYINLRWLMEAPGPITDSDVELASTCPKDQRVMIVGFNAPVMPSAERKAKQIGVEIRAFNVIYELFETVVAALEDDLSPEERLVEKGEANVLAVFGGRYGNVAGCKVTMGQLTKGHRVKVYRKDKVVGEGPIISLRRGKEDVRDVDEDNECGFGLEGWDAWEVGDTVRCFEVTMVRPDLVSKK